MSIYCSKPRRVSPTWRQGTTKPTTRETYHPTYLDNAMLGLLLCDDLMWISRLSSTAQALGYQIKSVRTLSRLVDLAQRDAPACAIIDLDVSGVSPVEIAASLKSIGCNARLVAFGAHVDSQALETARETGFAAVLTRGQLAAQVHDLLREWLAAPPA